VSSPGSSRVTGSSPASSIKPPMRRPLKIFAFDPMRGRAPFSTLEVEVENELNLKPGPRGSRIRVVDYDGATRRHYAPVDLDDRAILMQGGLDPSETNPRFHQQMVYAVAMKVLENFDRALGRRVEFRRDPRCSFTPGLTLLPHAFRGANAFFDPKFQSIRFGYFTADTKDPGPNLPGQTVFSCLSHDVIAHEMTHALVHRLREHFLEPSNRDVLAFHEGFSDIVAIFQHFTFPEVLRNVIQQTRGDLRAPNPLVELASQFGYATGRGAALRTAVDRPQEGIRSPAESERLYRQARLYETVFEPHERGSILVAAVFDAFFTSYLGRIEDLVRIATGGTGRLPEGDLHPDLVNRIADEASSAAQTILTMCIRAFDYLPPVDVSYGDYLRALVTADFDLMAERGLSERRALIEAFRLRGIYPTYVASLAEGSLLWPGPEQRLTIDLTQQVMGTLLMQAAGAFDKTDETRSFEESRRVWAKQLHAWASKPTITRALDLDPDRKIEVIGFHPTFRIGRNGELQVEFVAQFGQIERTERLSEFGGLPFRGGTTVIASTNGEVRYVISKPLVSPKLRGDKHLEAIERRNQQIEYADSFELADPRSAWLRGPGYDKRMQIRDFRMLHEGLLG